MKTSFVSTKGPAANRAARAARRGGLLLLLAAFFSGLHAAPVVLYSDGGGYQASATCALPPLCGGGVFQPDRATDTDLNNFALLYTGAATAVRLRLRLSATAAAGSRAGVVAANGNGLLNLLGLGTVRLRTLLDDQVQETQLVAVAAVQSALLGPARPAQLEFVSSRPFNQVELEIDRTSVAFAARVFYAYAASVNTLSTAAGYVSRFAVPAGNFSTASGGSGPLSACAATDVDNPDRAADLDLRNYASYRSLVTVACPSTLRVQLEGLAPAGYFAGFVVGSSGLLDLNALGGLRLRTFRNGTAQETAEGFNALQLSLLPDGQAQVSFRTTRPFNEVLIERTGLVSALDNLRLYYGFGVEPRAFAGTTAVLSNFADPTGRFRTSFDALLCLGCAVTNASQAADADTGGSSFATLNVPVGVAATLGLRLDLTQPGLAGNRAGVVFGPGTGLLDAAALDALTLNTYDAAGYLLESQRGTAALRLALLPDGRQEVFFSTTRAFAAVELEVGSGVAALVGTRVYYAFADDRPTGFPGQLVPPGPLPVELTAFAGRWANGAALLSWQTAAERHSQRFVIERAAGHEAAYQPVGEVAAAGHSNSPRTYAFRDPTAGAQAAPVCYYRLRQIDDDGRAQLSAVVPVAIGPAAAAGLLLYPNPAAADPGVTLKFGTAEPGRTVRLYSPTGQLLRETAAPLSTQLLPLTGVKPGVYFLRVLGGEEVVPVQRLQVE